MSDGSEPASAASEPPSADVEREHLRGSSLMVAGRLLSMGVNVVVQVLAVRHLGRTDYGVFAYALAWSALGTNAVLLGQDQALGRFLPQYRRADDVERSSGAVGVAFASVAGLGGGLAALAIGLHGVGISPVSEGAATTVLVILIGLSPLVAFDELFQAVFAAIGRPTAIFVRRHVVTPLLRLASVVFVVLTAGSVEELAWAYLITGAVGVALYVLLGARLLRDDDFWRRASWRTPTFPVRELWRFGVPVHASTLLKVFEITMVVVLIERIRSVDDVAAFRAVQPIALVNTIGLQSFRLLYLPVVSQLLARNDRPAVRRLYWRSAAWLAIGTFPVFVVTFALAAPLTTLLFGSEFSDAASVLAVLAFGFYISSSFGLNTHTVRAAGAVRGLVIIDALSATLVLGLSAWLIRDHGALGAAIGTAVGTVVQNVATHLVLQRVVGGAGLPSQLRRTYASVAVTGGLVAAVVAIIEPPLLVSATLAVLASVTVLVLNRHVLDIGDVVPEIRRVPGLRRLAGSEAVVDR